MDIRTKSRNGFFLLVIFIFLVIEATAQKNVRIRLDPEQATGGSVSEIFEEINYIPLETQKTNLFGKIDQLYVTDSFFIILDYDINSILLFYRNGKFHCKIEGGSESKAYHPLGIVAFFVDKERGEISYKLSETRCAVYNFNGKKIREDMMPRSKFSYYFPDSVAVHFIFDPNDKNNKNEFDNELAWQNNGIFYRSALPYLIKNAPLAKSDWIFRTGAPFYESGNDTIAFYSRPFDYTVYEVSPHAFNERYSFVFPAAISLPADFRNNQAYYGKRFSLLREKFPKSIIGITNFNRTGDVFCFSLFGITFNKNNTFFYKPESSTLISFDHITPEPANSFLPIKSDFGFAGIHTTDGSYFYSSVSSVDMFTAKNMNSKRKLKYPEPLNSYFSHGRKTDNPVIVQLKVKSNYK